MAGGSAWRTGRDDDCAGEGRFYVGNHVRDNGNGTWTYTYAVYNLNSHRSGASFRVPVPADVQVTNINFHAVDYHSGEPWSNADWVGVRASSNVTWNIDQPYNPALNDPTNFPPAAVDLTGNIGNALRWGTTHTYAFTADSGPGNAGPSVGLYRPGTPSSISASVRAPLGQKGDMNCDGIVSVADISGFAQAMSTPTAYLSCTIENGDINEDGVLTVRDIGPFGALLTSS